MSGEELDQVGEALRKQLPSPSPDLAIKFLRLVRAQCSIGYMPDAGFGVAMLVAGAVNVTWSMQAVTVQVRELRVHDPEAVSLYGSKLLESSRKLLSDEECERPSMCLPRSCSTLHS